jgi:hypothetical protein
MGDRGVILEPATVTSLTEGKPVMITAGDRVEILLAEQGVAITVLNERPPRLASTIGGAGTTQ